MNEIKVYIFIARNQDEYKKYRFADYPEVQPDINRKFEWKYSPSKGIMRIFIRKDCIEWLGDKGERYLDPACGGILINAIDNYFKAPSANDMKNHSALPPTNQDSSVNSINQLLNLGNNNANDIDESNRVDTQAGETFNLTGEDMTKKMTEEVVKALHIKMKLHLEMIMSVVNNLGIEVPGIKVNDSLRETVTIFMHWGGGERKNYENREIFVRKILPEGWKFFSIGSQRNDVFKVDRTSTIKIPYDPNDLDDLCKRLESSNTSIKDVLTNYAKTGKLTDDVKKSIIDLLAADSLREKLRFLVMEPMFKWLSKWASLKKIIDVKSVDEAIKNTADLLVSNSNDDKIKMRNFISKLLSEGIV